MSDDDITVRWGKRDESGRLPGDGALVYIGNSPTCGLLAYALETLPVYDSTLAKLLERNGYDLKTLRLTIHKKEAALASVREPAKGTK